MICGIDEAGRGPVLGPLVVAGVCATQNQIDELKQLGVTDSKLLSTKRREELFLSIKKIVNSYHIVEITPNQIDERVMIHKSLTDLELDATTQIIENLKPQKLIIDCPSTNKESYKQAVIQTSNFSGEIFVEFKADTNHVIVGAASILAKVTRDLEIKKIKTEIGIDFGSGYPSDSKTKFFLQKHWQTHSELFRKSWESYKNMEQKSLFDY